LGRSPVAEALGHLARLADLTKRPLTGGSPTAMREQYEHTVWEVDAAMIDALACVSEDASTRAVEIALAILYKPWLERHAERFQQAVKQGGYPSPMPPKEAPTEKGLVVLFVDGLRYDVGRKLRALLELDDCNVNLGSAWTAVPSVTASGKVLVSPAAVYALGEHDDDAFEPCHRTKKQPLKAPLLRKTLEELGWQVLLNKADVGEPQGCAWVETGEIDQYGHANQLRLARDMGYQLQAVRERVNQLLQAGWKRIRIVTDHGWLLVPGKLDKVHIEKDITETKWGRAAKLKVGAPAQVMTLPWTWCPEVQIAMAPGAKSFKAGEHYSHGGLSLQESLTPVLEVTSTQVSTASATLKSAKWSGLRLRVIVEGSGRLSVDLRTKASDKETSVVEPQEVIDGKAALIVDDDGLEGTAVTLVIVDEAGNVLDKTPQTIGG
jgi:PglZ domain